MKNLRVMGITLEQDHKIYVSSLWTLVNPITIFSALISKSNTLFYVEGSKKRVHIEQIYYRDNLFNKSEVVISEGIAKELGVTVGDKINIRLRLFGKLDNDYLTMYKKKPKKFIKYFSEQSDTNKKKILKELLEYDTTNEEVVKWLDKNYSGLIKEVGLE